MNILDAMTLLLIRQERIDPARRVVDWEESTECDEACETCDYQEDIVRFTLDNGETVAYSGDLGSLIRELTN